MLACLLLPFITATGGEAGHLCVDVHPRDGGNQSYDCTGRAFTHDYIGYDSDGALPCHTRLDVADQCDLGIGRGDDPDPLIYGYSISHSPSDPFVNNGPREETAVLYLWYVCTKEEGLSVVELSLTGTLMPIAFTPLNGFLNLGSVTDLVLTATGCPAGPVVIGEIVARDSSTPIQSSPWGFVKSRYR